MIKSNQAAVPVPQGVFPDKTAADQSPAKSYDTMGGGLVPRRDAIVVQILDEQRQSTPVRLGWRLIRSGL